MIADSPSERWEAGQRYDNLIIAIEDLEEATT